MLWFIAATKTEVIGMALPAYTRSTLHFIVSSSPVETFVAAIEIDLTSRPYSLSVDDVLFVIWFISCVLVGSVTLCDPSKYISNTEKYAVVRITVFGA